MTGNQTLNKNENNISDIARIALYNEEHYNGHRFCLRRWPWIYPDNPWDSFSYDGDVETAENAIYNTFGIKVDLTDYSIYDKKTKKVKIITFKNILKW